MFSTLNSRNRVALLPVLLGLGWQAMAQVPDTLHESVVPQSDISDRIEQIAERTDATLDYSELVESLRYYYENPLNLNYATQDELAGLLFLNDMQIYHLLAYRETYGLMVSIYELQAIEGFDAVTTELILPFVTVSAEKPPEKFPFKYAIRYGRHRIVLRYQRVVERQQGYNDLSDSAWLASPNSHYLGGPDKILARYRFNYANGLRWGITAEKDAGEPILTGGINDSLRSLAGNNLKGGVDFYSAHICLNDVSFIRTLSVGDYQLRFGQGLILWGGLAFGKTSDAANVKRYATGITPYTSSDENRFFRGAAVTAGFGPAELTAFYSKNRVDAGLETGDSLDTGEQFITSLQETGLHRTVNEIGKKDAVALEVAGGNVNYAANRFSIGITGFYTRLGLDLSKPSEIYNQYSLTGKDNLNAGLDFSYLLKRISLFGEVAMSGNGALAQLYGLSASLHPQFSLSVLYRDYAPDYKNLFANGFSESANYNEKGIYSGFRLMVSKAWTLSGYADVFSYPWLRYRVNSPSSGHESLLQLDSRLSGGNTLSLRLRQQVKQINSSSEVIGIQPLMTYRKTGFRVHVTYSVSPSVAMADRAEYLLYAEDEGYRGSGFLLFHDVNWRGGNGRLNLFLRYALFDTDSYDERIYAYENDVLYAFSVPAYYYKGSKLAFMLKYSFGDWLDAWFRISSAWLANKETFGSGLDEIEGNRKSEVKIQFQVKL